MRVRMPDDRRLTRVAGAALLLVSVVVVVSAAIRLGIASPEPLPAGALLALRGAHRVSASLDALAVFALAWFAWRVRAARPSLARAAGFALVLTLGLSALGVAGGTEPGPRLALGNLLGGLALAASLAWALGALQRVDRAALPSWLAGLALATAFAQCALGGWLAVVVTDLWSLPLAIHVVLGALLVLGALRIGAALGARGERRGALLLLLPALGTPAAGVLAALLDLPFSAALAHAAAAAALLIAFAYARARFA
jgi:hypothetical protein